MSHHSFQQPGFPLFHAEFEHLFLKMAAVTTLSTLTFTALGCFPASAAAADVKPEPRHATAAETTTPELENRRTAADLGEPMTLQLYSLESFDCLVAAAWEDKPYCSAYGPGQSNLLTDPMSLQFDLQNSIPPAQRLNLLEMSF